MPEIKLKHLVDRNFLEYASYVIKDRAIPHIDDGLKPVQRRILHTLHEVDDGKFHKVANIVGHTMRYHPHGDASIEDALTNLAQKDFFIDKQGNFGNIVTGDPASAARYIECRLTPLARETLFNPDITKYIDSYDGRNKEPLCLSSKLPSLLMLGVEGIAVGLSTKIFPHNFIELLEAQISILKKKDFEIFPDFIQGGLVDISQYQKGRGKIKVRAKIEIPDSKTLLIKEIPFGTNTEALIESIQEAINKGKLKISSINDFTTEHVEIELKIGHGAYAKDILPRLFLYTNCEMSLTSNPIVIKDERPIEVDAHEILIHNTNKLVSIQEQELNFKLVKLNNKLRDRIILKIFIQNKLYQCFEKANDFDEMKNLLQKSFEPFLEEIIGTLSDSDIDKLLSIPIKRISKFDLEKTSAELDEIQKEIKETQNNLDNITEFSIDYIKSLIKKYKKFHPRRTTIVDKFDSIDVKNVAVQDLKVFYDKNNNYLGLEVKNGESVSCSSFDKVVLFYKNGEYKIIEIPNKLFLGNDIYYYNRQDKDQVFSVIYFDPKAKVYFMKRFNISQFILNKVYKYIPDDCKVLFFSWEENPIVQINYEPKKKAKLKSEYIHLGRLLVKSVSSIGNQLATRLIKKDIEQIRDESVLELFNSDSEAIRLKAEYEFQPSLIPIDDIEDEFDTPKFKQLEIIKTKPEEEIQLHLPLIDDNEEN